MSECVQYKGTAEERYYYLTTHIHIRIIINIYINIFNYKCNQITIQLKSVSKYIIGVVSGSALANHLTVLPKCNIACL